ncbi:MAG: ATP-binding cassette domain-containing protein [Spirochaeta sp.]|nr:ATP-binding cassette domain-containing protein [Spirochaeta sp.]
MSMIRVEDVYKAFGEIEILRGLSLNIEEGEITTIIGQSGTGKSVFFKHLIGILKPDTGKIWFHDTEVTAADNDTLVEIRKHFGYAFQGAALFDSMNVAENIAFPLREVLGITDKKDAARRVSEMLDWIGLPGIENKRPAELSGGMRKRVGVARALVTKPDVLLFDEPTTGLDPVLGETINDLVVRVNKELELTCVVITHDIQASFRISDKIAFLHEGVVAVEGSPKEVARSTHPLVKKFIENSFNELEV